MAGRAPTAASRESKTRALGVILQLTTKEQRRGDPANG